MGLAYRLTKERSVLIFSVLMLSSILGFGQTMVSNRPINSVIKRQAASLLEQYYPDAPHLEVREDPDIMEDLKDFLNTSLFQTELLQKEWYETQGERNKRQIGLDFTATALTNEYGEFFDDDEATERFRVGLDWDLLDEGYLKWFKERKKLEVEAQIHEMRSLLKSRDRNYAYLYNCLIYSFNVAKEKSLATRVKFLESYLDLLYQLYFAHELAFEKIIDQKSRLAEAKILYEACGSFNNALEQELGAQNVAIINAEQLPLLQIDIEQLLNPEHLNKFQDSLSVLELQNIDLKYAKRNDVKLKLFSRYNYGDRFANTDSRQFFSFGATFRMPIRFDKNLRDELADYEKAIVEEDFSEEWYNRMKEIMILFEEYQFKLKQYTGFLHKIFYNEEKLRQERVLLESPKDVHSPMKSLGQIDNLMAINFELIHLKQQAYLLMLQIYLRSYQEDFSTCLRPLNLDSKRKKLIADRYLYFEPTPRLETQVEFISNYLVKNELYHVLLGPTVNREQWSRTLEHAGIKVYNYAGVGKNNTSKIQGQRSYFKSASDGNFWVNTETQSKNISEPIALKQVPTKIFRNRNELERWIELEKEGAPDATFLFDSIEKLMELDQKNLGIE